MTLRCFAVLLVLGAPATARANPPQCSGGTVVATPGQPKTLDFPSCDGAGDNPVVAVASPQAGRVSTTMFTVASADVSPVVVFLTV
jgi:hypothetical protein